MKLIEKETKEEIIMNKEMTIVWHDLIEDPNDLPPIDDNEEWSEGVLIQSTYGRRFYAVFRKLKDEEKCVWFDKNQMIELNKDTIEAWAYIPKYRNRERQIENLLLKMPVMVFHRIKKEKSDVYPESSDNVIVFKYDESKNIIVSSAGFYDKDKGWWELINRFNNSPIIDEDDVIGWSPFFEIGKYGNSKKEEK